MSHTTYSYTRDRLGFEPDREERRLQHYAGVQSQHYTNGTNGHSSQVSKYEEAVETLTGGGYEENLSKFKGLSVMQGESDSVQLFSRKITLT